MSDTPVAVSSENTGDPFAASQNLTSVPNAVAAIRRPSGDHASPLTSESDVTDSINRGRSAPGAQTATRPSGPPTASSPPVGFQARRDTTSRRASPSGEKSEGAADLTP